MFFARYADSILGAVLVSISGLLLAVVIPIGVQVPKSNKVLALSPDFWIHIIVWLTLALGLLILFNGIRTARQDLDPEIIADVEEELAQRRPLNHAIILAVVSVVGLFTYYFLITWIGMPAASFLAVIGFIILSGEHRLHIALPLAVLLPVGLYYFFLKVASIPMPLGIFS